MSKSIQSQNESSIDGIAPPSTQVASTARLDWLTGIEAALRVCNIRYTTDWETGKFDNTVEIVEIEAECTFQEMQDCVQAGLILICNRQYGINAKSFDHPMAYALAIELRDQLGGLRKYMRPYCWAVGVKAHPRHCA